MITDPAALAALMAEPAAAGRVAQAARAAAFGRKISVRPAPPHPAPTVAAVLRGREALLVEPDPADMSGETGPDGQVPADMSSQTAAANAPAGAPGWPEPASWRPGDRVVVHVARAHAAAYFAWLVRVAAAAPADTAVAPFCADAGGLFKLHLIAAARAALPAGVRVEARHDLLGVRLAQVALGFGADTLSGPLAAARRLPLAGVTRPDETTAAGLVTLVEQAGFEPVLVDISPETPT